MMQGATVHQQADRQALRRAASGSPAPAEMPFDELVGLALDPVNGWSIGSFGALGEFTRDAGEAAAIIRTPDSLSIITEGGAMRLDRGKLGGVAWESLASDGRGWGHNLAICVPCGDEDEPGIVPLGRDASASRAEDRGAWLFDLGVARGRVRFCVRTGDHDLRTALDRAAGAALLDRPDLVAAILRGQPHRVMLSPAGRIEVFQPIPGAHDVSPAGPHTHLLPGLLATGRLHGANDPIPLGWQAALSMHPPPPWSGPRGERSLVAARVGIFGSLLARYGLPEDERTARSLIAAIHQHLTPKNFPWFSDRRSRAKARIVLRQLAQRDRSGLVTAWRRVHDRCGAAPEESSPCREVVVWQAPPRLLRQPPPPPRECLQAVVVAVDAFRTLDKEVGDDLRPLVRIGLAALFQASRHVMDHRHVG